MTTVMAVYEHGVLRPTEPLDLAEGETVELIVSAPKTATAPISDDEYARRVKAAKSIQEWVEITKLLPPDDGGYDVLKALDENRQWSDERPSVTGGGDQL